MASEASESAELDKSVDYEDSAKVSLSDEKEDEAEDSENEEKKNEVDVDETSNNEKLDGISPMQLSLLSEKLPEGNQINSPELNPHIVKIDSYFVKSIYKGIAVDIHVDELTDATKVEVRVERDNGEDVVKINKKTGSVLNTLNTGEKAAVTAPMVIQHGTYDEAGSSSWHQPSATWDYTNTPRKIIVTIERDNGSKDPLVEEVNLDDVSEGLATLEEVMPSHPDPDGKHRLNISGTLYRDHKMNDCYGRTSCLDRAENLGEGWEVNLYEDTKDGWELLQTRNTNSDGVFKFSSLGEAGKYYVCPVVKNGWTQQVQTWSGSGYNVSTANNSGNPAEGPYCSIISYDDTGDRSSKGNYGMVDTTRPTVEILEPASGGYYSSGVVTVKIKSTDNESGVAQATANLYKISDEPKDTLLGSCVNIKVDPAQPEYYFDCDLNIDELSEGKYYLKINAKDRGNYTSNTLSWYFDVDKSAPQVDITYPSQGETVSGVLDFRGTVLDENLLRYYYNISGVTNKIVNVDTGFTDQTVYTWDTTEVADGEYTLRLEARDKAGNKTGASVKTITVTVDNTAPDSPEILFPVEGQYFNSAPILNDWTDVDDASGISKYRIQYEYDDGHTFSGYPYREATTSNRNHSPGTNEQGGVKFRVQAFDGAGNEGSWSEWRLYFYDATAPVAPQLASPADNAVVSGASITQSWETSDSDVAKFIYESYHDADATNLRWTGEFTENSKTAANVEETAYWWRVRAVDHAGNVGPWSELWKITVDNTAPTSAIIPPDGATVTDEAVFINNWDGSVSGVASDSASGISKVLLSIENDEGEFWDGSAWVTGTEEDVRVQTDGQEFWTYTMIPGPEEGVYTFRSHAVDNVGNIENTAVLTVVYDTTISEVVLSINPEENDGKRGWYKSQPTIVLTATDPTDTIEYQWDGQDGAWQTYTEPLSPVQGTSNLYYRATDTAGNISEVGTKTVLFDSEAPSEPQELVIHRDGNQAEIVWEKAEDNLGIYRYEVIWVNDETEERFSEKVDKDTRSYLITDLDDGHWEVRVRAEDRAGWTTTTSSKGLTIGEGSIAGVSTLVDAIGDGIGGSLAFLAGEVLGAENGNRNQGTPVNDTLDSQEGFEGQVAGATTECSLAMQYLPMIMLVALLIGLGLIEMFLQTSPVAKSLASLLAAGVAIVVMWLLSDSNCYTSGSITSGLNSWFWLVALASGLGARVLGTLLLEDK